MSERTGYAVVPVWMVDDPTIEPLTVLVYLVLASYVGNDDTCWPSQSTIAEKVGCDVRTVQRHIATLRDRGVVAVSTRATRTGRCNVYTLASRFGGARSGGDDTPAPGRGGDDTSVGMGDDTGVVLTRTSRTRTTPDDSKVEVETRATGALVEISPEEHPSRRLTVDWQPRPHFRRYVMHLYPHAVTDDRIRRFVAHHIGKRDTSFSWEAMWMRWVSSDHERDLKDQREGTDDLGVPYNQRPDSGRTLQPGDDGYVDPEELARQAIEAAEERSKR